jgi:lipoyl(octanoyl) transferase
VLFDSLVQLDDPEPHSAALNMAIDEVLLRTVERPLLRCYRWAQPAVSFGYFGHYAEVLSEWPGRDIVRRWTGGGTVPHGDDFTYSLLVPRSCPFAEWPPPESYRVIHEVIARVLNAPGLVLAAATAEKVTDACFANPVRHDLVTANGKVAGAAQRRTRCGLLHQGSIQFASLPSSFATALAGAMAINVEPEVMSAVSIREAESLAAVKYGADEWLRRA